MRRHGKERGERVASVLDSVTLPKNGASRAMRGPYTYAERFGGLVLAMDAKQLPHVTGGNLWRTARNVRTSLIASRCSFAISARPSGGCRRWRFSQPLAYPDASSRGPPYSFVSKHVPRSFAFISTFFVFLLFEVFPSRRTCGNGSCRRISRWRYF